MLRRARVRSSVLEKKENAMGKQHLTLREKFGFGLGDTASNIVYQAVINVLMYF